MNTYDKIALKASAFDALSAGALNHGRMPKMEDALAQGMMPLFMVDFGDDPNGVNVPAALAKSKAHTAIVSKITGLNPTSDVFNKFKQRRRYKNGPTVYEIPNDNLMYRNSKIQIHYRINLYISYRIRSS